MAAIHVLEGDGDRYRVISHSTTPAGNNAVGNSWVNVLIATGKNVSVMTEGVLIGQITTAELASITAGTLMEAVFQIPVPTTGTPAQKQSALNNGVTAALSAYLTRLQNQYQYFGYTNG